MAYAVDTLILSVSAGFLQEYLDAIASTGRRYGLALHSEKFQLLNISCTPSITSPDGVRIQSSQHIGYLGTILDDSGTGNGERSRRLGLAKLEFRTLSRVWKRSALSCKRKIQIYRSLVESKLLYGLAACCLTIAQQRRLNGMQAG